MAVDARLWAHSGIGRWLRGLLPALVAEGLPLAIWAQAQHQGAIAEALPGQALRLCPHAPLRPWDLAFWPRALKDSGASVLFWPHFDAPPTGGLPLVAAVHDLIPLDWPGALRRPGAVPYMRWRTAWTLKRADGVLVHAQHVGAALQSRFGLPAERLLVAPPALDAGWLGGPSSPWPALAERLGLGPGPFVLAVGLWKRHKDLPTLLAAASEAGVPGLQVVLVGEGDPREGAVLAAIAQAEAQGLRVLRAGPLPDADLRALYAQALALGFPSRAEGFGLPPLEALALGCPVLAAEGPWLDASVGEAAWRLPPGAVGLWAEAIAALAQEAEAQPRSRAARRAKGLAQAQAFTWGPSARALATVLRRAARGEG